MAASRKDSRGRVLHKGESEEIKGGRSYYVYKYQDVTGKRARISATSLPELREKEKKLQADVFAGIKTGREREKTLADMVQIYLGTKINLKATTASNYEYMARKYILEGPLGAWKVKDIKKSDIQRWYGDLLKSGFRANSLEVLHTILHPTFQRAIDDGYIRSNPTQGVMADLKKSEYWKKPKKPALTIEQQTAFIDFIDKSPIYLHWKPLFTFLLGTGCRVGEVIGLTWEDVDLFAGIVTIRHNLVYRRIYSISGEDGERMEWIMNTPKTEDGCREIPMLSDVRRALLSLRRVIYPPVEIGGKKYNFVFRNRFGVQLLPSSVNRAIDRIVRDYNDQETENAKKEQREPELLPDFSVHQLRHTFATRLCENSSNVKAIQEIMGHADIETTMNIYADATRQAKKNTLDELEGKVKIS